MRRALLSVLALLLVLATAWAAVPASAAGGVFTDVKATTPFAGDIEWLAAQEIAQGGDDGRFRPTANVTRQAMAVFLYKFANRGTTAPACLRAPYKDVPKRSAYCGSITWLGQARITSGTANGGFSPLAPVTRQSMAAFLYHLQYAGAAPPACTADAFDDVPKTSSFCGAVKWLSRQRITTGDPAGNFDPTGTVTRGMMAAFLHRFELLRTARTGVDVSYPQCSKALPAGQAFGIVGVNGGKPGKFNGCFEDQMQWAAGSLGGTAQPPVQVYVNTANPGEATPSALPTTSGTTPYGVCAGKVDEACAYEYGRLRATEDVQFLKDKGRFSQMNVWLDVETSNSWDKTTPRWSLRNIAVLEGFADALLQAGVPKVGLYSTTYQWTKIAGKTALRGDSPLLGRPSWLAGATSLGDAMSRCTSHAPLTSGGRVELVQYVEGGFDRNVSCT